MDMMKFILLKFQQIFVELFQRKVYKLEFLKKRLKSKISFLNLIQIFVKLKINLKHHKKLKNGLKKYSGLKKKYKSCSLKKDNYINLDVEKVSLFARYYIIYES